MNSLLAKYYQLDGNHTFKGFQKVPLPANSNRGGFITQSAFLTMGSNGERSSPVIRGTLILGKLLNSPPPDPPPNVPEIESASSKPLSNRALVELHRKQRVCASCHDRIDPIGFGLENFDTTGLWRDPETIEKKEVPIEANGTLVSGVKFNGLQELQKLLKSQEDKLARNIIESLTSYGIGRPIEFSDESRIDEVLIQAESRKYALRDLIFLVANSETFRSK